MTTCDRDCFNCKFDDCIEPNNKPVSPEERKEYDKEYYQKNREAVIARSKEWADSHKEEKRASSRRYYQRNREELQRKRRERYWKKKEKENEQQHYEQTVCQGTACVEN